MTQKKAKIDKIIKHKVNCECKGKCKYLVKNKKINNFEMDFCSEYLFVLTSTKKEEA